MIMRPITALLSAGAFLPLVQLVAAVPSAPGVFGLDFHKAKVQRSDYPHLARRQSKTVQTAITNELSLYLINVTVGTPPQPFSLQLDTGSSDVWFPDRLAPNCEGRDNQCIFGVYNPSASSTFVDQNAAFQINYVDGTQIEGEYITDVLTIGSAKIKNMTMAAALTLRDPPLGVMGIGYQAGESIAGQIAAGQGGSLYLTVVQSLQSEGFINRQCYSLWLNDLDSNTGSILFGGVDTDKYHGDLIALPVQIDSQTDSRSSFTVAWTGLSFESGGVTSDLSPASAQPAILDSGTTITLLPDTIADNIFNGVGVITDATYGNLVPCTLGNDVATFSFTFGGKGGPVIQVSLSEFLIPLFNDNGSPATFNDGTPVCQFGIDKAGSDPILFGDTFLRSAYVVYDLDDNVIGLAQTNFNATGSNIVAFSSAGIPGAKSTASAVTVTQTFSGFIGATATQEGGAFGTASLVGTSRSATFHLSTATGTSSSGGKGKNAASGVRPPALDRMTILAGLLALASALFGGSLMLFL